MQVALNNKVAEYHLVINEQPQVFLNQIIGKNIYLEFSGLIKCIYCKQITKNSYSQGYCYNCARKLARCDLCIVNPKNCHYHLGTCREPEWGLKNCFSSHTVYLANSSGVKVGLTKTTNIPARWIDQGAVQALPIMETSSRLAAGLIEAKLAKIIPDKTNWRKMLNFNVKLIDLIAIKNILFEQHELINFDLQANIIEINYPTHNIEYKINFDNLKNSKIITGKLLAIKGQYLIFPQGIINIRHLIGYQILVKI